MTTPERTKNRPSFLRGWIRNSLPDSDTGLCITDIDWLFSNYKEKIFMFVEEKTQSQDVSFAQGEMFKYIHNCIIKGMNGEEDWKYLGFHLLKFEGNDFTNIAWFDKHEVTEEQLIEILSMKDESSVRSGVAKLKEVDLFRD